MKAKKRFLSLALSAVMVFSLFPQSALAREGQEDGLCRHHPRHDADCGYAAGEDQDEEVSFHTHTAGCYRRTVTCVHVHGADCYGPREEQEATESSAAEPVNCTHTCSEESGCVIEKLVCGYEEGEEERSGQSGKTETGSVCGYVCRICPVQELIDALPAAEEITAEQAEEIGTLLDAVDEAKR